MIVRSHRLVVWWRNPARRHGPLRARWPVAPVGEPRRPGQRSEVTGSDTGGTDAIVIGAAYPSTATQGRAALRCLRSRRPPALAGRCARAPRSGARSRWPPACELQPRFVADDDDLARARPIERDEVIVAQWDRPQDRRLDRYLDSSR